MNSKIDIKWKHQWLWEQELLEAMKVLFAKHPDLFRFVFDLKNPALRFTPEKLIENSYGLSSVERLLVRIALDIWNGSGSVELCDLLDHLDFENYNAVLTSLAQLAPRRSLPYHPQCKSTRNPDTAWGNSLINI